MRCLRRSMEGVVRRLATPNCTLCVWMRSKRNISKCRNCRYVTTLDENALVCTTVLGRDEHSKTKDHFQYLCTTTRVESEKDQHSDGETGQLKRLGFGKAGCDLTQNPVLFKKNLRYTACSFTAPTATAMLYFTSLSITLFYSKCT